MILPIALLSAAAAFAAPASSPSAPPSQDQSDLPDIKDLGGADPKATARLRFLHLRELESQGIPAGAADSVDPSKWGPKPAPWAKLEGARAADFDARFGRGAYRALTRFCDDCRTEAGCDFASTADLLMPAYGFIDLKRRAAGGAPAKGSPEYLKRDAELKTSMRDAIQAFRPTKATSARYRVEFRQFAEPLLRALARK